MTVRARDHHEAKRLASDAGCEDIISIQVIRSSLPPVVVVLLVVAGLAFAGILLSRTF